MNAGKGNVVITKIAAAERQLNAAIRMFFAKEDELAIHTVASAAFRVLRDIGQKRGKQFSAEVIKAGLYRMAMIYNTGQLPEAVLASLRESGPFFDNFVRLAATIKEQGGVFDRGEIKIKDSPAGERRMWNHFNKIGNFLKHADNDADSHIALDDVDNRTLLLGACSAYLDLMGIPSAEMLVYSAYHCLETDDGLQVADEFKPIMNRLAEFSPRQRHRECIKIIRGMKNWEKS